MEQILPQEKKKLSAELNESIPPLLSCLEDRNADVRKHSQSVLPLIMAHTGHEPICKAANKLEVFPTVFQSCLVLFSTLVTSWAVFLAVRKYSSHCWNRSEE